MRALNEAKPDETKRVLVCMAANGARSRRPFTGIFPFGIASRAHESSVVCCARRSVCNGIEPVKIIIIIIVIGRDPLRCQL